MEQHIYDKPFHFKQVAYKYRETLYQRELTDGEKEKYLFLTAKRVLDSSESRKFSRMGFKSKGKLVN